MSNSSETNHLIKLNWNPLKTKERVISFKSIFTDSSVEILLFDLKEFALFHFIQDRNELENSFKEYNPSLEAPIEKIINHLKESFLTYSQTIENLFAFEHSDGTTKLVLNSKLSGAKFRWEFEFKPMDPSEIREHLVLPLMYSCAEYQSRELEMIRLLQAKDKELDDYKSQGVKLSRKHLGTEIFSLDAFEEKIRRGESKEIVDQPEKALYTPLAHKINEGVVTKYMSEMIKRPEVVKLEPNSVKVTQPIESDKNANQLNSASQKESRLKELEDKLKAEEKNKTKNKKKKLF